MPSKKVSSADNQQERLKNENLYRFCVRSVKDIDEKIIPFFKMNLLRTAKKKDYELFSKIVHKMAKRKHLSKIGMMSIAKLTERMNRKKKFRFLKSSETKR